MKDKDYIKRLLEVLKQDPNASNHDKSYKETENYLLEINEKDGSVLGGLIVAMETYLNK